MLECIYWQHYFYFCEEGNEAAFFLFLKVRLILQDRHGNGSCSHVPSAACTTTTCQCRCISKLNTFFRENSFIIFQDSVKSSGSPWPIILFYNGRFCACKTKRYSWVCCQYAEIFPMNSRTSINQPQIKSINHNQPLTKWHKCPKSNRVWHK